MDSKTTLSFFLIFSSCVFLGFSGGKAIEMSCIKNLLPCKPYLPGTEQPPPVCCLPLKDMVAHQAQCLCSALANPDLLKDFNVTMDGALKLAKTCGASVDMSVCKNGNQNFLLFFSFLSSKPDHLHVLGFLFFFRLIWTKFSHKTPFKFLCAMFISLY